MWRKKKEFEITHWKGWNRPHSINRRWVIELIMSETNPIVSNGSIKRKTIAEACKKQEITPATFYWWLREDPQLRELWDSWLSIRKDLTRIKAREIIYDGIDWETKLKPKEKIELSKWFLEKTDWDFNPKQVIENKNMNLNFELSLEDLEEKLKGLINN
jgi:hypothetical protein